MGTQSPLTINGHTYTFRAGRTVLRGFDVYRDGVWIAWTGGTITDARNTAKDMAKQEKGGSDAQEN